jgi:hypothetical protein
MLSGRSYCRVSRPLVAREGMIGSPAAPRCRLELAPRSGTPVSSTITFVLPFWSSKHHCVAVLATNKATQTRCEAAPNDALSSATRSRRNDRCHSRFEHTGDSSRSAKATASKCQLSTEKRSRGTAFLHLMLFHSSTIGGRTVVADTTSKREESQPRRVRKSDPLAGRSHGTASNARGERHSATTGNRGASRSDERAAYRRLRLSREVSSSTSVSGLDPSSLLTDC